MSEESSSSAIELRMTGPGVEAGHIPLSDLAIIAGAIQKAVRQLASVIKTGSGYSGGRLNSELEALSRLELSGLSRGSVVLDVDLVVSTARPFEALDPGALALSRLVDGIDELNAGSGRPDDWIDSVYRALLPMEVVLNRGQVDRINFSRKGRSSTLTNETSRLIKERAKTQAELVHQTVYGRLMMVDFDSGRRRCRIEPADGSPVECTYPFDLVGVVREALTRFVKVSGYVGTSNGRRQGRFSILDLELLRTPAGAMAESPIRTIDELVKSQGLTAAPVDELIDVELWTDSSEVDEFLAWVQEHRHASTI